MSYVSHKDIPVLIGINERGLFIIDHYESVRIQSEQHFAA